MIAAIDVLHVINYINANGAGSCRSSQGGQAPSGDGDGDSLLLGEGENWLASVDRCDDCGSPEVPQTAPPREDAGQQPTSATNWDRDNTAYRYASRKSEPRIDSVIRISPYLVDDSLLIDSTRPEIEDTLDDIAAEVDRVWKSDRDWIWNL